jgi:hypothetical protein
MKEADKYHNHPRVGLVNSLGGGGGGEAEKGGWGAGDRRLTREENNNVVIDSPTTVGRVPLPGGPVFRYAMPQSASLYHATLDLTRNLFDYPFTLARAMSIAKTNLVNYSYMGHIHFNFLL